MVCVYSHDVQIFRKQVCCVIITSNDLINTSQCTCKLIFVTYIKIPSNKKKVNKKFKEKKSMKTFRQVALDLCTVVYPKLSEPVFIPSPYPTK